MASYIALLQFTEQGVRNIKDTTKRAAATTEMASKLGAKLVDVFWNLVICKISLFCRLIDFTSHKALAAVLRSC